MITRVVFCPQPLFLLPEYQGEAPAAPALTRAAVEAVSRLSDVERVVVVTGFAPGGGAPGGDTEGGRPAGGGAAGGPGDSGRRPAGVRVAQELLALAGVGPPTDEVLVPFDLPARDCLAQGRALAARAAGAGAVGAGAVGLLVMADGSARRGEKAPGYVDERAFAYDDAFVGAIERGAPHELAALDAGLAGELLFQGRAALQVAAGAVGELTSSSMTVWKGDPFGVMYVVAEWVLG